jgi:hypothetical protein
MVGVTHVYLTPPCHLIVGKPQEAQVLKLYLFVWERIVYPPEVYYQSEPPRGFLYEKTSGKV